MSNSRDKRRPFDEDWHLGKNVLGKRERVEALRFRVSKVTM